MIVAAPKCLTNADEKYLQNQYCYEAI